MANPRESVNTETLTIFWMLHLVATSLHFVAFTVGSVLGTPRVEAVSGGQRSCRFRVPVLGV